MAAILPTKGNLMAAKRSRALAVTGYDLMDRKRNILIREMMSLMDTAKEVQSQIDRVFTEAYAALQHANIRLGICGQVAEAVDVDDSLELQYRSVMGVELPHIPDRGDPVPPDYGFADTGAALDDAFLKFRRVKALVQKQAEVETSIYRLAVAIRKTQKRANALQNIVIPGLDGTIRTITDALEEKEREEFVRLKVIKRTKAEQDAQKA
ncbi:V-type ATP synthase subunit D [Pseudoflavonifractor sp. MSJ-37]|uniref:V-type ATP synthase subunit D n=1 Tax=Pseudoflavonifractor sp. MSJ-37 TaxID=2841531 RepID=UPI001C102D32|nr:V-type ATP synthase subunit D [Pseudoflavonifractor sp. MSJ-37]MBU5435739.1 V-type ATP synthase subunit D [Pseudoflavonifractor sp. MSJ-37]